jgi:hypothetical protein
MVSIIIHSLALIPDLTANHHAVERHQVIDVQRRPATDARLAA